MYSWIASFFTEGDEESQSSLYAAQESQQSGFLPKEEWTWIEVIEDEVDKGLIFVQSDETERERKAADTTTPIIKRKRRRIQKSEIISRKMFKRSMYTDLPLMRGRGKPMKRLSQRLRLNTQAKYLCKVGKTTSEVLSSTFDATSTGRNNNYLMMTTPEFDIDVSYLLNNATFLKSLLEGILKHQVKLDGTLQQWLESLVQSSRNDQIRQTQVCLQTNRRRPLSIEWYNDEEKADADEIEIIEVRYPLPKWMQRIDVVDEREDFPKFMKNIIVANFHNACGESHCQTVHFVEPLTHVPRWLRRMDVCEPYAARDRYTAVRTFPSWMRKMNVINNGDFPTALPSWMTKINVIGDPQDEMVCFTRRYNLSVKCSKSWFSSYSSPCDWISVHPRAWIRPIASETSLANNAQVLCNSMINFAMVLATATCNTTEKQCQKIESMGTSVKNTVVSIDRKKRLHSSNKAARHQATNNAKKNKKWLNKVNTVAKLHSKRQRYAAKSFSGRKCERAC